MTRRKPTPARPDLREPWQIAQAAECDCRGTDDMCRCQNEKKPYFGTPITREELIDMVSDSIDDTIDMDWQSSWGAKKVVDDLIAAGHLRVSA